MQNDQQENQSSHPEQEHPPVTATPQNQMAQPAKPSENQDHQARKTNAVQIVWQLLTYALWSWALTALSILLGATLNYYVADKSGSINYEFSLYALAALIVLVPLAFVADRFYAKDEPEQKHGFGAVVMVLIAVIVFLTTLAGFITAVVTALSILVNPGDTNEKVVIILTSLVVSILGGLLFIRILNPAKLHHLIRKFPLVIVGIVGISVVFASFGPFASEIAARDDKLLEENLPALNTAIQNYARKHGEPPKELKDLEDETGYDEDARLLVDKNLVEYKVLDDSSDDYYNTRSLDELSKTLNDRSNIGTFRNNSYYQLCVTYKRAKGSEDRYDYGSSSDILQSQSYDSYIDTYSHKAGRQCYKLQAYLY